MLQCNVSTNPTVPVRSTRPPVLPGIPTKKNDPPAANKTSFKKPSSLRIARSLLNAYPVLKGRNLGGFTVVARKNPDTHWKSSEKAGRSWEKLGESMEKLGQSWEKLGEIVNNDEFQTPETHRFLYPEPAGDSLKGVTNDEWSKMAQPTKTGSRCNFGQKMIFQLSNEQ